MTKQSSLNGRGVCRGRVLLRSVSSLALAALTASAAHALPVRDDVGPDAAVDTTNQWAGVGQMFNLQPAPFVGLCTGQLVNPRTVIFAAHCVHGDAGQPASDQDYGALTGGIPISFGFNVQNNFPDDLITWINDGHASQPDLNLYNVLQVQTVFNIPGGNFPQGDIAIASFDTHIDNLPTYGMLFSPLLESTHATVVGYGRTGTGSAGDNIGIDFKRRVGENMIDGLFSQNDFVAGVWNLPGIGFDDVSAEQLLYHIDFDRPDRDPNDCARGDFFLGTPPDDIVCNTPPFGGSQPLQWDVGTSAILTGDHIDWYPGDALPNEAGTAGGDSGSALFADQIHSRPLITGVLSGGWVTGFFSPNGGYGDVSYYNPLFLYRDWIIENNPYVYASARHGNGNWSDPKHWVQDMDPNYFVLDEHGKVRNDAPSKPEPGLFADEPKWGTVFDLSVPDEIEGDTGASSSASASSSALGDIAENNSALVEAPDGFDFSFGGSHGGKTPTASKGAPTGPGSKGFVPNNDWGAFGTWSGPQDGVARFYDVTLNNIGTTKLDMNVEIDRLTVSGHLSALDVKSAYQLNALIAVDQHRGFVNVDGVLQSREYALWGGFLTGKGAINAETLWNVKGVVSAGGLTDVGELTINGDYVQSSLGGMLINIKRHGGHVYNDFIQVNGDASLAGNAIVAPVNFKSRPRWRDKYNVLHADNVVGNFDDVHLVLASPILFGESVVQPNGDVDIVVEARKLSSILGSEHSFYSLGAALDELRWDGRYNSLSGVFSIVDGSTFETFETALFSLAPQGAFMQANMVLDFNSSFTGHLSARSAELRAGASGVSFAGMRGAFSQVEHMNGAPSTTAALTPSLPNAKAAPRNERFGIFVSSRSFYDVSVDELYPGTPGGYFGLDPLDQGPEYDAFSNFGAVQGDFAIGADYRLSPTTAIGVSFSASRFDFTSDGVAPISSNDNIGMAVYATKYGRNWFVDGYYGFSRHNFELQRTAGMTPDPLLFDADSLTAMSAPDSSQTMAGARAGWTFPLADGFTAGPLATVNYSNSRFGAYEEYAGGDFNLIVDERELTSVALTAGAAFEYSSLTEDGRLFSAVAQFSAAHELTDDSEAITAAFSAAPDTPFTIERMLDTDWYTASAGFTYAVRRNLMTQFQIGADFDRGPLDQHFATVGFNWRF